MGRLPKSPQNNVVTGQPAKPSRLSERASAEWDRLSAEIAAAGIHLTEAHRAPLTLAATIAADIAEGWKAIQEDGAYITTKAGLQAHPATKRIDALRRDYIKVLGILGLRAAAAGESKAERTLEDIVNG